MASFVGKPMNAAARALIEERAQSAVLRMSAWLDRKIGSRTAKVVAGILLGVAAMMLIAVFAGLPGV
jgi:hypothetical protein